MQDVIKVVAIITMVLDHAGLAIWPEQEWMRWIGRISYPMFAVGCGLAVERARDLEVYLGRMMIIGLAAEAGHEVVVGANGVNAIPMLGLGVMICMAAKVEVWAGMIVAGVVCAAIPAGAVYVMMVPVAWCTLKINVQTQTKTNSVIPRWLSWGAYPGHYWLIYGGRILWA